MTRLFVKNALPLAQNLPAENYRLAQLCDRGGDLSKRWYVEFYALDATTSKLKRSKPIRCSTRLETAALLRKWAKGVCHEINMLLLEGYAFPAMKRPSSR